MRWIDRGPEPATVADYARRFTPGWVDYFRDGAGSLPESQRPDDSYWREFRPRLGSRSGNICWYCERQCNAGSAEQLPTVDHFQPISRFPRLAYAWSNWIFSCRRCNDRKGNRWPDTGYVDPCAAAVAERPEQYFDYAANTGEVIPRPELSGPAQRKAWTTIDDLGLNDFDLMFYRLDWADNFRQDLLSLPASEQRAFIAEFAEPPAEYAGFARMLVEQLRQEGRIPAE